MPSPRIAAKTMLRCAREQGFELTNLKLHKLLYLAHGAMLAKHEQPLIEGEAFSAWKYGPVLESLYHDLKVHGANPINADSPFIGDWPVLEAGTVAGDVMKAILAQFGRKSAAYLIDATHDPEGPWSEKFKSSPEDIAIDDSEIKTYFRKYLRDADRDADKEADPAPHDSG